MDPQDATAEHLRGRTHVADSARRETAGRLARHAETRTAMIALLEARDALDRAGCYDPHLSTWA